MVDKRIFLFISFIFCLFGCSAGGKTAVKVTRFSPPLSVSIEPLSGALMVKWKPSPDEVLRDFAGYNIYYEKESLLLRAVRDLPQPIEVSAGVCSVVIRDLEPERLYFIHLRSRKKGGELSVPSLPEIVAVPRP